MVRLWNFQALFLCLLFSYILAGKPTFVEFNRKNWLHIYSKLPDLNYFPDILSHCYHLVVVNANDTDVETASAHEGLEFPGHFVDASRRYHPFSDIYEDHLSLASLSH